MADVVPLEDDEQIACVEWLELQGLKYTSIPNNTYTKSWKQKRKNHALGLRKGFNDMIVLISPTQSLDGEGYFLCIENKRRKGGTVSPDQKSWHDAINGLNVHNVQSYVAKGSDEFIKIVSHYLKAIDNSPF